MKPEVVYGNEKKIGASTGPVAAGSTLCIAFLYLRLGLRH